MYFSVSSIEGCLQFSNRLADVRSLGPGTPGEVPGSWELKRQRAEAKQGISCRGQVHQQVAGGRVPSPRKTSLTHSLSISVSHRLGSQGNTVSNTGPGPTTRKSRPQNEGRLFQEANGEHPLDEKSSKTKSSLK